MKAATTDRPFGWSKRAITAARSRITVCLETALCCESIRVFGPSFGTLTQFRYQFQVWLCRTICEISISQFISRTGFCIKIDTLFLLLPQPPLLFCGHLCRCCSPVSSDVGILANVFEAFWFTATFGKLVNKITIGLEGVKENEEEMPADHTWVAWRHGWLHFAILIKATSHIFLCKRKLAPDIIRRAHESGSRPWQSKIPRACLRCCCSS
mmetsp:Transcript_12884/g.24299  ORF Transcript_12884/g.24299 Transcript_12884/m.24299 type:complete len:211 (+) Transcript_12884:326-958(+)